MLTFSISISYFAVVVTITRTEVGISSFLGNVHDTSGHAKPKLLLNDPFRRRSDSSLYTYKQPAGVWEQRVSSFLPKGACHFTSAFCKHRVATSARE